MYQTLLTRRYLTSKIMPLLAAFAVMLCTAMVLIVWSVMGGFLNTLLMSGRTLIGDVSIFWPNVGFAYYGELCEMLEKDPAVAGASPVIETYGMISLPDGRAEAVQIRGVEAKSYPRVINYEESLWWKPIDKPVPKDHQRKDPRLDDRYQDKMSRTLRNGLNVTVPDPITGASIPAAVPGIESLGMSKRYPEGYYDWRYEDGMGPGKPNPDGTVSAIDAFAPDRTITIRVLPLDTKGQSIDLAARVFPIANEFRTGVYEVDKKTVLVPLATLQTMLKMDEARTTASAVAYNPYKLSNNSEAEVVDPARVTTVLVRAAEGVSSDELRSQCEVVYAQFEAKHRGQVPSAERMVKAGFIRTWEMQQARFIGAVKQETTLVLMMLGIISLTASALILAIFWAMVAEKTKDIGVLRSIGASRSGVAMVWISYGLAIGVLGSVLGGILAYAIVLNINPIHDWLGATFNVKVWDPKVYYFTEIPNKVETFKAVLVLTMGMGFSVLGALIPAVRAARLDPVKALRFE